MQAAREAARRAQCCNNLMQLAIAMQNYESSHEMLPPGVVNPTGPILDQPKGYHFGWLVQILPYCELRNVYNHFNFKIGLYEPQNFTTRTTLVRGFLCPSDPAPNRGPTGVAMTNYVGCSQRRRGADRRQQQRRPVPEQRDPVSKTSPTARRRRSSCRREAQRRAGPGLGLGHASQPAERGLGDQPADPSDVSRRHPVEPATMTDAGYRQGPTAIARPRPTRSALSAAISSRHPGGANFAFGDGSVRFLKNSIGAKRLPTAGEPRRRRDHQRRQVLK